MITRCMQCNKERRGMEIRCEVCGGPLEMIPDFKFSSNFNENFPHIKEWISLGETITPVLKYRKVSFKLDYYLPTFSYKDRGYRAALSALLPFFQKNNIQELNEDSSGNAGASLSGYGAAAGMRVNIFVPESAAAGKIRQIESYGAKVMRVKGNREDVANEAIQHKGFYMSHVLVPEFRDGIRSLAYEIFLQGNGSFPDRIYIPASAGTLLLGLHKGIEHLFNSGEITDIPKIIAVQPELINPICCALEGKNYVSKGKRSIADALVTERSLLMERVVDVLKATDGKCISVTENEIKDAWKKLASHGMLCEFSSAAAYAGFLKKEYGENNLIILTGNGLKSLMQ
ncbi:MAG: pyridoxal-phosphate dependent enzyme [Candidatus Thermoplasmatota archaeon]|nr:pyridoxal-phosphate dependent enzyme [Candidatus Thermoplasmatota archaeon]MCL5665857.1 pyridoxal-phosphate dependent enzyme [Candidatus Thermoplasmatota archaeon]